MVQLADTLTMDQTARICADGSLVVEAFAARCGMQDYAGYEVDPENSHGLRDRAVVKVYRPESEVFKLDSLATFAAAPVTVDHPSQPVDASNWKALAVGEINGDVVRDGHRVRVPLIIRDADAVAKATTTHKQLSMGYGVELQFPQDGKHPDGTACDAYQVNPKINHIALVRAARGGPELRVVDERPAPKEHAMKIKIGDAEVDATNGEAVRVAVYALNSKLGALTADNATLKTAVDAKDGEIAGLNAKLKDAEVTPAKLQLLADARAKVIASAQTLKPGIVVDGKTDAEIRKEAVEAKLGDDAKDMADAAIEGAFTALTKDAKPATMPTANIHPAATIGDAAQVRDTIRAARYA